MEKSTREKSVSELFEEISRDAKPIFEHIRAQFSRYDDLSENLMVQASTHLSIVTQLFIAAAVETIVIGDDKQTNAIIKGLLGYMNSFLSDSFIEEGEYMREANQILDLWMGQEEGEA